MPAVASTTPPGADRRRGGAHRADPRRLGRRHAAEPLAARRRRAVRRTRGARAGPHRPRHRTRAGLGPGDHAAAAPERHDERRRAVPRPHPRHPLARLGGRRDRALHERRHVRRARDAGRDRHAGGLAARLERLLGAARRGARPAVRVRESLLGSGTRARARPVSLAVPGDRDAPRAADVPHRRTRSPRRPPTRPRPGRSPTSG